MYILMAHRGWRKYVTGMLLLWAVIDLSIPVLCQSENWARPDIQAIYTTTSQGNEGTSQSRFDYEDDCFCCCSHIVPRPHFELSAGLLWSLADPALLEGQPDGSVPTLYHPPRN